MATTLFTAITVPMAQVEDALSGAVNRFAWNPEGTLARWSTNQPNSYARVFGYDEEGRLTRIERDYGSGNLQMAYEYGYNSEGVRVWKRGVPVKVVVRRKMPDEVFKCLGCFRSDPSRLQASVCGCLPHPPAIAPSLQRGVRWV